MNPPNLIESYVPCSGRYSLKKDLRLNAWLAVTIAQGQLYFAPRPIGFRPDFEGV
jgi:hypothetical protein